MDQLDLHGGRLVVGAVRDGLRIHAFRYDAEVEVWIADPAVPNGSFPDMSTPEVAPESRDGREITVGRPASNSGPQCRCREFL